MKKQFTLLLLLCFFTNLIAQNTVGLLSYNPTKSFEGYNLIYPHNQSTVFLLNNCGEIVHTWEDDAIFRPGNMAYILENGDLFKTKRLASSAVNDPIWAGGGGETVELRNWNNALIASYSLNNENARLHHDLAPLPNGNVLMVAWENKTGEEALAAGRDTSQLSQGKIWPETILEWNPISNAIVWEWHIWDHLVQDFDSTKTNFGIVAEHPELVNINYDEHDGHPDWLHINSIDYNPVLDQIVLSIPYFNELWIIDHSTTTEEAATHSGGNSGKGGDLLYRWGNPIAYNQGTIADKKLFFQHDVNWVDSKAQAGEEHFGKIALFNNRVASDLSTGNIINTNFNTTTQNYELMEGRFMPTDFEETYQHPRHQEVLAAASVSVSSFQVLPNDNVLFCSGRRGYSYEITPDNQVVWEYFTPIKAGISVEQGDTSIELSNNLTFRLTRYDENFPAFGGKDLSPKGYIEINPTEDFCGTLSVSTEEVALSNKITAFPNPTSNYLTIEKIDVAPTKIIIFDVLGRKQLATTLTNLTTSIDVNNWEKGIYFLSTDGALVQKVFIY